MVSVFYDSMLAKLAAWGQSRDEAVTALIGALNRYHIEGVVTNMDFTNAILNHPAFIQGDLSTAFIDDHFDRGGSKLLPPAKHLDYMVIAATLVYHNRQSLVRDSLIPLAAKVGRAHEPVLEHGYVVQNEHGVFQVTLRRRARPNDWDIRVNRTAYRVETPDFEFYRRRLRLSIDGDEHYFRLQYRGNFIRTAYCGIVSTLEIYTPREWRLAGYMPRTKAQEKERSLRAPMPGLVVDIKVQPGERVYRGQDLVVIESMKMESGVAGTRDGEVDEIMVQAGQAVETGDVLLSFKAAPSF